VRQLADHGNDGLPYEGWRSTKRNEASAPISGMLNTVWHRAVAFVTGPHGVEALVPEVAMHAYYAGARGPGLQQLAPGNVTA